jgi:tRNA (cytidine56-2'-O)-methyltransferase
MTTHVGLTARALGADRVVLPAVAGHARDTVADITDRFGGPFTVSSTEASEQIIRGWTGNVAHLTMYGEPVEDTIDRIRPDQGETPLLVVVGAGKVAFDIYEQADWNVAVTNQPHSEVAALAVFLDRLFQGRELDREWRNAERTVVPRRAGKQVEDVEPAEGDGTPVE